MEQVFKLFFVLVFGFFLQSELQFQASGFQNIGDVFATGFSCFAMFGDEATAQLINFRGRPLLHTDLAGSLQDERFFCVGRFVHRFEACSPARSRRYLITLLLCSASVALKKCPPWVLATKYR